MRVGPWCNNALGASLIMDMQTSQAALAAGTTEPEDFSSIVLTIDHLAATDHEGGHQVHKFVCSTQSLIESMIALFAYYGMSAILQEPSTIALFQQAGQPIGLPVFILHTEENTQVVADADTWAVLLQGIGQGSMLQATEALIDMVGSNLKQQIETQGKASTLSLLSFSAATPQEMQEFAPAPEPSVCGEASTKPSKRTRK